MRKHARILVAEDNAISQLMLLRILASEPGYEVQAAGDGKSAWAMVQQEPTFDLCIFDVMMPQMSGIDVLRRMREDERLKSIPVMLCSALRDRDTIKQGADLGIEYYVLKPFQAPLVLEQVAKALKGLGPRPAPLRTERPREQRSQINDTIAQAIQLLRTAAGTGAYPSFPVDDVMLRSSAAWPEPLSQPHLRRILSLAAELECENEALRKIFDHPAQAPLS